jgi:hypothetical protein
MILNSSVCLYCAVRTCKTDTTNDVASLSLPQPAPILSTAWFPTASTSEPASFCFVGAVRDTPIKLFDASDGRVLYLSPEAWHRTLIRSAVGQSVV